MKRIVVLAVLCVAAAAYGRSGERQKRQPGPTTRPTTKPTQQLKVGMTLDEANRAMGYRARLLGEEEDGTTEYEWRRDEVIRDGRGGYITIRGQPTWAWFRDGKIVRWSRG